MLIHPWDQGTDAEWRAWLAEGRDFGILAANGPAGRPPVLVPTHFLYQGGDEVLLHLARPNPLWAALEADPHLTLAVIGDYAFVPGPWRPSTVPTSYYASVQLSGTGSVIDGPEELAALLERQAAHFQPDAPTGPIVPGEPPYGRMLSAIRGLRLRITEVRAKFKYDDNRTVEHQEQVAARLADRALPTDAAARAQLLRRRALRADGVAPQSS